MAYALVIHIGVDVNVATNSATTLSEESTNGAENTTHTILIVINVGLVMTEAHPK